MPFVPYLQIDNLTIFASKFSQLKKLYCNYYEEFTGCERLSGLFKMAIKETSGLSSDKSN